MEKAYDVIYTKQQGFYRGHEFVIQKTTEHTHTVFAETEASAKEKFTKETNIGDRRIKKVVESNTSNMMGSMFPALAKLKSDLESKTHKEESSSNT
jgi:hypothetical protein